MISPGQFVPVYEKEGYITRIDSFMVNSVIAFNYDRMLKKQKVVPCAVNLSRVDFYDVRLLEMLKTKLVHQINIRDMLKLEVTESAYAELESDAISFLNEMKALGLALMLDDFGSGMSSFSTLENFEWALSRRLERAEKRNQSSSTLSVCRTTSAQRSWQRAWKPRSSLRFYSQ